MKPQSTNAKLLWGAFHWKKNAALCAGGLSTGIALWVAGVSGYASVFNDDSLLEFVGGLIVFGSLLVGAMTLLFPYLERASAESALFMAIDKHRLVVRGVGRLKHIRQEWNLDSKTTFSDSDVLIASGQRLGQTIEKAILASGGVLAPTIIIAPFWNGKPFNLRPAERYVVNEAAQTSQALTAVIIDPEHPLFDTTLISRTSRPNPRGGIMRNAPA